MTSTTEPGVRSFPFRYATPLRPLMTVLGMGPGLSAVEVAPNEIRVRMGWAFRARIPLLAVQHAEHAVRPLVLGWGVHGWGGRWLVNASTEGVVRIDLSPPVRVHAVGLPVRLTTLWVALADPTAFLTTAATARTTGES